MAVDKSIMMLLITILFISGLAERQTYPLIGTKFANTTVYAAMIMTDPMVAAETFIVYHKE